MEDLKISDEEPAQPVYGGGPLPQHLHLRQSLAHRRGGAGVSQAVGELAENKLIDREFGVVQCSLGGPTRSTFLMVFSPDRQLMASTHGDHNIYVTAVKSGACVQTLKGHPRTPWCIAFHPSHEGVIASGCLGGQVRVWDLHCGSELWVTDGVIASLAFHPVDRLLVIATFNELHFWDWSQPAPTTKVLTSNEKEKVRYVKFDKVGHQLVTGIANLSPSQQSAAERAREGRGEEGEVPGGPGGGEGPAGRGRGATEDQQRYSVIMDRYERLMERYHTLTSSRARDLEWPERGASRAVDQPELVQAAVREGEGASRLLSDLAQVATESRPAPPAGPPPSDLEVAGPSSPDGTNPYRAVGGPRYRRYSLLLDRDDLDGSRPRAGAGRPARGVSRGREGARLRRADSFREPGDDWAAYRRELRERMLELRRLRDLSREGAERRSAARDIQPASSILDLQDRRPPSSPFHHSAESGFLPVTPGQGREEGEPSVLDIVGPPERSEPAAEEPPEEPRGMRIPVWTGGRERRSGFPEDFGEGSVGPRGRSSIQEIDRVLRDSERVLRDSERVLSGEAERILDEPTTPVPFPDPTLGEVQRVTLSVEGRQNNNSPPAPGSEAGAEGLEEPLEPDLSPTRTLSPDGLLARNYVAMGLGRRSVLLRRRQAQLNGFLSDRLAARRTEHRLRLGEARALGSLGGMSPPASIPLLTPTQIVDRMESAASGQARSPGRSPGRSAQEPEQPAPPLRPRIGPRGRRSTADAPSGSHSERMAMIQAELAAVAENPFTSRPPSSASEIDFELPGAASSTVASPVHRPLTARGRYSVDIQPEDLTGRSSVGSELGRSSADSGLRRSFSSDHNPDVGLGVLQGDGGVEEDFNSDSSNSRPSSRMEGPGDGGRRLYERSQSRSRRSIGRRTSLLRLTEEVDMPVIPLERATSASSAVAPAALLAGRSPRGGDTDREGEDSGDVTDVPLDTFETELGPVRSYELAPDSVPSGPGDTADSPVQEAELEVAAEELPSEAPLLDINENRGEQPGGPAEEQQVFTEEEIVRRLDEAELARSQAEGAAEEEPLEATFRRRHSLDIALLSRHIDHMQRICRASLTDLTLSRQRRQIIRLQGIRRMLEDLQRQIRTLQASSELAGTAEEPAEGEAAAPGPSSNRFPLYPGRHRHLLPRLRRSSSGSLGSLRTQTMLASRSRLSRAHNQLVSQLRATFRAMEMSPDLARRDSGDLVTTASQSVLEHTDATSTRPLSASLSAGLSSPLAGLVTPSPPTPDTATPRDVVTAARNDLRSMSQRLERLLRERREATERRPRAEERDLERRTLDILDRRLGRGAGRELGEPGLHPALTDSSPSDSEEERGEEGPFPGAGPRLPGRDGGGGGLDMLDYFNQDAYLRNRRTSRSAVAAAGDSWRPLSMRERLDIRAGLRREGERERARLSRERDLSLRRVRYRSDRLAAAGPADSRTERLPPLRELIWRRLRRRTGQQGEEAEEEPRERGSREGSPRERSRHREFLSSVSWAVDQLTIDPEGEEPEAGPREPPGPPPAPAPPPRDAGAARVTGPARFLQGRLRGEWGRVGEGENTWGAPLGERRPPFREYHFMQHTPSNIALTHRIQTWDFSKGDIPDISNSEQNIVVKEAKIHNDASVDISEDGSLLVTLVPSNLPMTTVVGLYSLGRASLGDCYATYSLESSAVSVSLSPTSRHLLVGLTSRTSRIISLSPADRQLMAQVFRIKLPACARERGRLIHRRDINQVDYGHMSLNCIRWIPVAGQGIVFATNTGLLKILR